MGKTWSGPDRKKFGRRKTKRHKARSKWSAKNGGRQQAPRLRTLEVDLREFQAIKGDSELPLMVSLPAPEDPPKKTKRSAPEDPPKRSPKKKVRFDQQLERDVKENRRSLTGIGLDKKRLYDQLPTPELTERIEFYRRQCQFLTASARSATKAGDPELATKIRKEKDAFLIPEMNSLRLYLERFR